MPRGRSNPSTTFVISKKEVVGLEILRRPRGDRLLFARRERDPERLGDLPRDLVLDFEHVLQLAVIPLDPEREVGVRVDELRADPQPVARAAQPAAPR